MFLLPKVPNVKLSLSIEKKWKFDVNKIWSAMRNKTYAELPTTKYRDHLVARKV